MHATVIPTLRSFANLLAVAFCLAVIFGLSSGNVAAPIAQPNIDTDLQESLTSTETAQATVQMRLP